MCVLLVSQHERYSGIQKQKSKELSRGSIYKVSLPLRLYFSYHNPLPFVQLLLPQCTHYKRPPCPRVQQIYILDHFSGYP